MIDIFSIFSKGGLVLVWYIQNGAKTATIPVNSLIKSLVQDQIGTLVFNHERLSLKYKLDSEYSLVYVVGYQSVLELDYMDKFLTEIALEFRDKYKNELESGSLLHDFSNFTTSIDSIYKNVKELALNKPKKEMMTFYDSYKSSKTVKSMTNNDKSKEKVKFAKNKDKIKIFEPEVEPEKERGSDSPVIEETMQEKAARILKSKAKKGKNGFSKKKNESSPFEVPVYKNKKGKENTKWETEARGAEAAALDYNKETLDTNIVNGCKEVKISNEEINELNKLKGQLKGNLADVDASDSDEGDDVDYDDDNDDEMVMQKEKEKKSSGFFTMFRNWAGVPGGNLTEEQLSPIVAKLRDHLIFKNVARDVAVELCNNVSKSLIGQKLGTFERINTKVQKAMEESCYKLLCCGRRVDILRDVIEARRKKMPYVITFCGVNGVGKSTNLAKITFWLIEQGFRVMIAACDTFRAGAVEQLRVHVQKLNHIHPPEQHNGVNMVHLYQQGYAKDAASVAFAAINSARDNNFDVVMIDTSGRMQDNEPLMRSLAKLITVNQPDLVLFVGEALVGNEAVDQLVKFNKALQDFSQSDNPRTINGIVLSKFDIIDDKVGAAISMTYIIGQPIMFVGTGQTYADLRKLSPAAVVKALMK